MNITFKWILWSLHQNLILRLSFPATRGEFLRTDRGQVKEGSGTKAAWTETLSKSAQPLVTYNESIKSCWIYVVPIGRACSPVHKPICRTALAPSGLLNNLKSWFPPSGLSWHVFTTKDDFPNCAWLELVARYQHFHPSSPHLVGLIQRGTMLCLTLKLK